MPGSDTRGPAGALPSRPGSSEAKERPTRDVRPWGGAQPTADAEDMELKELLGEEAPALLEHQCKTISRDRLVVPGPDFVDRVLAVSDRPPAVLRNLQHVFG